MKKKVIFICLLLGFTGLECGSGSGDNGTVVIGYSRLRISLPVFVASERGIFKKNGLNVELVMFDTAQPLMDALCGGKVAMAGYTALPITFSAQLRSRKDLLYTTLLMEDANHPISMFVVKKDSNIRSLGRLKGKKIGILPTYAYRAWLEFILEKNNIRPDEVTIQQVAPAMTPSVLESGTVDVMFTNDPAVTTCIRKGVGRLLYEGAVVPAYMGSPFPFASFNVTRTFSEKNPDITNRVIKSLDEAIDFINSHQAESKKIMGRFLPESQKSFVSYYPDALFIRSKDVKDKQLHDVEGLYLEQGIIKGRPVVSVLRYR